MALSPKAKGLINGAFRNTVGQINQGGKAKDVIPGFGKRLCLALEKGCPGENKLGMEAFYSKVDGKYPDWRKAKK